MVLAGAVLGCSGSLEEAPVPHPPSGYPMAFAEDECAPWDGAAVAIYLTDKHLRRRSRGLSREFSGTMGAAYIFG